MNSPQASQAAEQKPGEDFAGRTLDDIEPGAETAKDAAPDTGMSRRARIRETVAAKATRIAEARFDQACEMAIELRHKRGCPEEDALPGEPDRRVEHYTATKPRTETDPAVEMLVVRCVECGEEEVLPDESENR